MTVDLLKHPGRNARRKSSLSARVMRKHDYTIPVRLRTIVDRGGGIRAPVAASRLIKERQTISVTTPNNMTQQQISSQALGPTKRPMHVLHGTLLSILLIAVCMIAKDCLCDTQSNSRPLTYAAQESTKYSAPVRRSATSGGEVGKTSHKEMLLSTLSEQIERNHFKINPFGQQRPSKFDEGKPLRHVISNPMSQQAIIESKHQHSSSPPTKKADDSMRHILMMHDHAIGQKSSQKNQVGQTSSSDAVSGINKWRDMTRSPTKVITEAIKPTKVLSHVLSYMSPLVGSKLINQASLQSTDQPATSGKIRFNPFALVGANKGDSPRSFVTSQPRISFLAKPDRSPQQVSTQPSFSLDAKLSNQAKDLMADESSGVSMKTPVNEAESGQTATNKDDESSKNQKTSSQKTNSWLRSSAEQVAQNYLRDSMRALLTLSQLPILPSNQISTAPSVLERGGRLRLSNKNQTTSSPSAAQGLKAIEELYRYAYILATGVQRKRDPLKALGSAVKPDAARPSRMFGQRSLNHILGNKNGDGHSTGDIQAQNGFEKAIRRLLGGSKNANPRGVMWDMATDPSLAVTVFHLLERASVALPLGFLLMPMVQMIRNPLNGFHLGRILPPRASHRSVDYEELAKRLDVVDKILNRALRPTHREMFMG